MASDLKSACAQIVSRSLPPLRLPDRPATALEAERIRSAGQSSYRPPSLDLNAAARGIAAALAERQTLSRKQIRDAPWCLWDTNPALARDQAVLAPLMAAWDRQERPAAFRSLSASFMKGYGPEQAARDQISALLRRLAERWGGPWGELDRQYAIFDLERGPRELAREVIRSDRSPLDILRAAAIGDIAASGGLARQVVAALLRELADQLDHEKRLSQVQRFALRPDGQVRYEDQAPAVMEALGRPFLGQPASTALQDKFLAPIVRAFGDPRLRPGNWHGLPHRDLVLGWLSRQSLRQFLDVVDATTINSDGKRMWRYRRQFWEGVYDYYRQQGLAIEAWVAFGAEGQRIAKRAFGSAEFAALHTIVKQVRSDHAVLLFKVADCVVADWNHNGKCHIWSPHSARPMPKLYKRQYGSDEVQIFAGQGHLETSTELTWGHGGSENYSWQRKIADRLGRIVGIPISDRVYRLR